MFESLECRQFMSVSPAGDVAPVADTSAAPAVSVDATAEKKAPKPKGETHQHLYIIPIISILIA